MRSKGQDLREVAYNKGAILDQLGRKVPRNQIRQGPEVQYLVSIETKHHLPRASICIRSESF